MPLDKIKQQRNKDVKLNFVATEENPVEKLKQCRERAFDRVETANTKREIGSYVRWGVAGMEEVICKECGTPLRGLVPDPTRRERRTVNGKEVVFERLVMATFPEYTEITMDFDDGSHHVTVACKSCADKLKLEDMEWHYATDMLEMDYETRGELKWHFFCDRIPTAFHISYVGEGD